MATLTVVSISTPRADALCHQYGPSKNPGVPENEEIYVQHTHGLLLADMVHSSLIEGIRITRKVLACPKA